MDTYIKHHFVHFKYTVVFVNYTSIKLGGEASNKPDFPRRKWRVERNCTCDLILLCGRFAFHADILHFLESLTLSM